MRRVVRSRTYVAQLKDLLDQGIERFGAAVVEQKLAQVDHTLEVFLARHPKAKRPDRRLGLRVYLVTDTPFIVLYDFTETELRAHFIFHKSASLEDLDPNSAEW
jgi:plasmid stabilization system protein ParE